LDVNSMISGFYVNSRDAVAGWKAASLSTMNMVRFNGVNGLQHSLTTAVEFASEAEDGGRDALGSLLRVCSREAHHLREWDTTRRPSEFAQQVLFRAVTFGETSLADRAARRLGELAEPYI